MRIAGDAAVVLELEARIAADVNARAIGIAAAVREAALPGVRDVVPTYRSVAVYFDPLVSDRRVIVHRLEQAAAQPHPIVDGALIEIPVAYGGESGPDLDAVAAMAGLPAEQVVARHAAVDYRVFMLGFMPGFAYLGSVDERIAVARRDTPRTRVPAGSVGIAGVQTGVYPLTSPGGWQLIGRTGYRMFDASRPQPALCRPGDRVRFVPESGAPPVWPVRSPEPCSPSGASGVTVLRPGLFTTVQDEGRWGHQASGVTVSGAMDGPAHRCANGVVGNAGTAATLEVTLVGPELRVETPTTVAVSGADLSATIDGRPLDLDVPVTCPAGSVIRFADRKAGGRAYIAFGGGGLSVPRVLGSAATHVRSGLGGCDGRQLRAGDRLAIGGHSAGPGDAGCGGSPAGEGAAMPARAHHAAPPTRGTRPRTGPVTLRAIKGPQDDCFPEEAFDRLEGETFTVHPQSDRMGYRLSSPLPLPRLPLGEMISDATYCGALQVPPDGQPILLMADRQTTGGYPIIAVVITADIPTAGQLLPGDAVRFQLCGLGDAHAALAGSRHEASA